MARGTTGAPRNALGQETGNSQAPGYGDPGARQQEVRSGGAGRLIAFVCGRRTKYVVVVFWLLVVAALGGLAGKLQGAEKNDASAYLPSSAQSTQELNEQSLFQSKNLNPALVVYVRDSGVTAADLRKATADARYFASLPQVSGRVAAPVVSRDHKAIETVIGADLGYNSDLSGFVTTVKNTAARDGAGLSVYVGGPGGPVDRPAPAPGLAGDRDPARRRRGRADRVQVRRADRGPVVPRHPAVDHRPERDGQVLPGRLR